MTTPDSDSPEDRLRAIALVTDAAIGPLDVDDLLEEEVRQGVRVPIGVGFAGHVAADRRAIRLDVVDSTTVWNPIPWEKGIVKMLGVPLLVGSELLGVLHVGRIADLAFTDDDEFLLELVAARISGAVQSRQLEVERAAARIVQRSLLPSTLPHCPG